MNSFLVGLQFLTRIHLSSKAIWKDEEFGKSVMWFPVIGWIIGLFLVLIFQITKPLDTPILTGFLLVIGEIFISGGTLTDGLMDASSLTGSFGMLSILIYVFLTTLCLGYVDNTQAMLMLLIAMPTLGRLNLVISICNYNYARP